MFPTPFTVQHTRQGKTGENALGQDVLGDPQTVPRDVSSLRHRSTTVGTTGALKDRVIIEYSMATPDSDWTHGDTVTIPDGRDFIVEGGAQDFNSGPFGFEPGYLVTLRRVEEKRADDNVSS